MLDAGIYEQLSRLVIAMKQKSSQNMAGNRRSVQKGTSAEFSDFREYMPGDDLRRLDWNVYARSACISGNISKKRKQWYRLF